ncbi:hypothetical protein, partial [Nonomuraea sp. NPDC049480]|uniref:hypothetical protein n=1 Tax=Nonomuraea sp. NPDC049480 TaxID=3364353 RepID=UPI0037B4BB88
MLIPTPTHWVPRDRRAERVVNRCWRAKLAGSVQRSVYLDLDWGYRVVGVRRPSKVMAKAF